MPDADCDDLGSLEVSVICRSAEKMSLLGCGAKQKNCTERRSESLLCASNHTASSTNPATLTLDLTIQTSWFSD